MRISGLPQVLNKLRTSAKPKIGTAVARGLKKAGLALLRESQQLVPVDTGNLRGTGKCRNVGGSGFDADVVVAYGGENCNYAVYVHEDTTKKHGAAYNAAYGSEGEKLRGEKQQAKFLEQPAREMRSELIKIIVDEGRKVL